MKRFLALIICTISLLYAHISYAQNNAEPSQNKQISTSNEEQASATENSEDNQGNESKKRDPYTIPPVDVPVQKISIDERAIIISEKANHWAMLQTIIGGLGLLFVVAATVFTGLAWRAGKSANMAAWAAVKSDRAWITFDRIAHMAIFQGEPVTINTAKVRVHWKNTGNTPALKVTCSISIKVSDNVESACDLIDAVKPAELSTETHVGPNQEFFSEFIYIPAKEFLSVVKGSKTAVVYCVVKYKDIRHPKVWRTSKFWQRIVFNGNTIGMDDAGVFTNLVGVSVFIRSDEIT